MGSDTSTKSATATATASAETSDANALRSFPFYEEGKVPQYQKYHAKVSYLDELELIWGKRWGAQGIGRLREVAMVKPTETEVKKLYEEDSAFFVFNGTTPNLRLMQEQHLNLARTYEKLDIKVHYSSWAEDPPRSAYGPMKRSISAAAGFVINGGAIIPREATPYWRGRSRYVVAISDGARLPDPLHGSRQGRVRDRRLDAHERRFHRADAVDRLQPRGRRAGHSDSTPGRIQGGASRTQPRAALCVS